MVAGHDSAPHLNRSLYSHFHYLITEGSTVSESRPISIFQAIELTSHLKLTSIGVAECKSVK